VWTTGALGDNFALSVLCPRRYSPLHGSSRLAHLSPQSRAPKMGASAALEHLMSTPRSEFSIRDADPASRKPPTCAPIAPLPSQQAGNRSRVCLAPVIIPCTVLVTRPSHAAAAKMAGTDRFIRPSPQSRAPKLGASRFAQAPTSQHHSQRNVSLRSADATQASPPHPARPCATSAHPNWVRVGYPGLLKSTLHSALRSQAAAVTPPTSRRHRTYAPRLPPAHPFWGQVGSPKLRQADITLNSTSLFGVPTQHKRRLPIPLARVQRPRTQIGCAGAPTG
jgi:hypothetical protein